MGISIAIHSYRGGTGKSTITANLAVILAALGLKIVAVDLDITSPGLHVIYGVSSEMMRHTLNDFLYKRCKLRDVVLDITSHLGISRGKLYFIGSSMKPEEIAKLLKEGYNEYLFKEVSDQLINNFGIDIVLFDTHPGLTEDTMISVLSSELSLLLMRMDKQDITGTYITSQILRKFGKVSYIVLNMVPPKLASAPELANEVSKLVKAPVVAVIPFYEEVLSHRSRGVFVLKHPKHPFTSRIIKLAETLLSLIRR